MTKNILKVLRMALLTIRLAMPKLGVGWMFALLTVNFNRIAIVELNVTAVAVTAMLAFHYFLSPFQVISGRFADMHPIAGYRRTPYLYLASIVGSIAFLGLPSAVIGMGNREASGFALAIAIFVVFGVSIAIMGDSHHSMIAEVVSQRARGGVVSVVWTVTILSTIVAAVIMKSMMPEYDPVAMQALYNLTPPIVIGSVLLGTLGVEKRLKKDELASALALAKASAPIGNPVKAAATVLKQNQQARGFFAFVFIAMLSIFLQDNILEVFGAEVFSMSVAETTSFQQAWGGGVLLGMLVVGFVSVALSLNKRSIAITGALGITAGMSMLAFAALSQQQQLLTPSLVVIGLFNGCFNIGALSMMMDMTVEGATGLYMGLWGMAQAFGTGMASFSAGALHTALIETGLVAPHVAYFGIFASEAVGMLLAAVLVWRLSVSNFLEEHQAGLSVSDALLAMESGSIA